MKQLQLTYIRMNIGQKKKVFNFASQCVIFWQYWSTVLEVNNLLKKSSNLIYVIALLAEMKILVLYLVIWLNFTQDLALC